VTPPDAPGAVGRRVRIDRGCVCERDPISVAQVSAADAARCFKTDEQEIEHLAVTGEVHRVHNCYGDVMVCCNSLFKRFDRRATAGS
jgi:hypothetical protein